MLLNGNAGNFFRTRGKPREEKEELYISLGKVLLSVDQRERLLVCGDMNGHVGMEADGFEGIHGGHGFGNRNVEAEMLFEFADAMDLAVANTWFQKSDGKLVTHESGGVRQSLITSWFVKVKEVY